MAWDSLHEQCLRLLGGFVVMIPALVSTANCEERGSATAERMRSEPGSQSSALSGEDLSPLVRMRVGLWDGRDKSGVKTAMAGEGVFSVRSPNTVNEWGWAVTPWSVRTLPAVASVDMAVGIAAYAGRG